MAKGVVASANVSKRSASPLTQRVTIESGTDTKKEPSSGWIAYLSKRGIGQGCVPPPMERGIITFPIYKLNAVVIHGFYQYYGLSMSSVM